MTTPRQFTLYTFEDLNITATSGGVFYDGGEPATATDGDLNAITVNLTDDDGYLEDQPGAFGANDSGDNQILTEDVSDEGTTYLEAGEKIYALGSGTYYNETTGETGTYWVIGSSFYTSSEFGVSTSSPINAGDVISYGQIDYYDNALPYGTIVAPEPEPDGVVDGEATGEVMDVGYDDADGATDGGGDLITDGDDTILGNGGNDTITAGGGDDLVEGGAGDDSILGVSGEDTIYGDGGTAGTEAGEVDFTLDWSGLPASGSTTVTSGSEEIGVTYTSGSGWTTGNIGGTDVLYRAGQTTDAPVELSFDEPVADLTFELFDIDEGAGSWDDEFTILALDADGNPLEIQVTNTSHHVVTENPDGSVEIDSGGADHPGVEGSGAVDSVTVTIPGPVSEVTIVHGPGEVASTTGTVGIADLSFSNVEDTEGEGGNDTIDGGEDADLIYGQEGDDSLLGGEGDDTIYGDSGSAGSVVSGGEDYTLDWSGLPASGSTTLTSGGEEVDVTYTSGTGWTTGNIGGDDVLYRAGQTTDAPVEIGFDTPVENLTFELFDIDEGVGSWDDEFTILALDADGNPVEIQVTNTSHHVVTENPDGSVEIDSGGASNPGVEGSGAVDSVTVTIPGPVSEVTIIHGPGEVASTTGTVGIADLSFTTIETTEGEEGGNDTLIGGEGADVLLW